MTPIAPQVGAVVGRIVRDRSEVLGRYRDLNDAIRALAKTIGVHRDLLVLTKGGAKAIRPAQNDCVDAVISAGATFMPSLSSGS